jgi:fatty acid desaturase
LRADRGYVELRAAVVGKGLLERDRVYYAWRSAVSFAVLAGGLILGVAQPGHPPLSGVLASLVIAFGSVQVALIGHDAGHLAIFKTARANLAAGWVCWSLVLGIGFPYWSDRHTRHHTSTNDLSLDPDLQWAGLVAYSDDALHGRPRAGWMTHLMRYQALLGPLYTLGLAFAFRAEGWAYALRRLHGWRRAGELSTLAASAGVWLLPAVFIGWTWLLTFCLAQILAGLYLALAIAPNHKGMPTWPSGTTVSFLERQVLSSRNTPPHPISDFVFGGLNHQIEHHLFPTMPRSHFGRARSVVRPFCHAQGIAYQEMGVWQSYGLVLSELRRVGRHAAQSRVAG